MKALKTIATIVGALAIVAGVVFVIVKFGDKIAAWFRRLIGKCECTCEECDCTGREECCSECDGCGQAEEEVEEVAEEGNITADEKDFEKQ